MKHNVMLTVASLPSILFMTFHLTSDTLHARVGTPETGGSTLVAVPILVVGKARRTAEVIGAARQVIFTGDLPGSNPRLWSDDGLPGSNPHA